jgi:hypothetical protein
MEDKMRNKLELFASNAQTIKKEIIWQNILTKRLAALLYAQENKPIDCEAIRQCHTIIKQNTGVFSTFRGDMAISVSTLLALSPEPQRLFEETLKVYNLLKSAKFRASDYLVIAAYQIAEQTEPADYQNAVDRARAFYDEMKARHFFLTGQDDYIFAAMLGLSNLDVANGVERIEQLHIRLKDEFWNKNSVQALSQVLVLGGSDDNVVDRILALRDALKAQKIKMDKPFTLPILGILALLPVVLDETVRDIGEVRQALRLQKGFGSFSVTSQELLILAAALVAGEYVESVKDGILTATLSTSITNIIIAQHVAMIAAVSASSAAAASSSAS